MSAPNRARWLSMGSSPPPALPPKVLQAELQDTEMSVQNAIPLSVWRDRSPLSVHIVQLSTLCRVTSFYLCHINMPSNLASREQCRLSAHVSSSRGCQLPAPPACVYCAGQRCSWQSEDPKQLCAELYPAQHGVTHC